MSSSGVRAVSQPLGSDPKETLIFHDNMAGFAVGGTGNYYYFSSGGTDGDDAVVAYDSTNKYLDVNSGVGGGGFTKTWTASIPDATGGLDHVKYLVYRNGAIPLPDNGDEFVYEAYIAAQTQPGTVPSGGEPMDLGVTNAGDDIRIAGAAINTIDYVSWIVCDIFFSNETIYAFYERLPFGKPSFGGAGPDYHAFSHCIPIAKRNKDDPLSQFDKVAIAYNRAAGTVRYLVNDQEKFVVKDIGLPIDRKYRILDHAGPALKVDLQQTNVGFGTFTLLDMNNPVLDSLPAALAGAAAGGVVADSINPNRPLVQLGLDAQYIDPQRTDALTGDDLAVGSAPNAESGDYDFLVKADADTSSRLFGNGARLRIKWLRTKFLSPAPVVSQSPIRL